MRDNGVLKHAVQLIECVDYKEVESVVFENNSYKDGTSSLNIAINYPSQKKEKEKVGRKLIESAIRKEF